MRARSGSSRVAARTRVFAFGVVAAGGLLGFGSSASGEAAYCADLRRVTELAATRKKLAVIAGEPREGSYLATTLPLAGWRDCSLYGSRTYTCDSQVFATSDEAGRALAALVEDVKSCLGEAWIEDKSRSSPVYVVVQNAQDAASITLSTDVTDGNAHVVRLILFLRGR
jgi:hypothetical protein